MAISIQAADMRAAFLREMHRLHARPLEGGPHLAIREGVLVAWIPGHAEEIVNERRLAALATLPDGAGCEAVAGVLAS